jgi:hypothetical protein
VIALNFYSRSCSELVESIIGMHEPEDNITLDNNNALGDSIEKSFSRKRGFRRNMSAKLDCFTVIDRRKNVYTVRYH